MKAGLITRLFLLTNDMSTKKEKHDRQLTATKIKKLFKEAQEKLEGGELAALSDAYHNLNCQYNSYFLQEAVEIDESPITAEMITAYREDLVDAEQRLWGG